MSKRILKALNQRPIAYYPIYAQLTGSVHGGILLSQLMYWFSKKDHVYKVARELMEELHFTERQLKTAKKALKKISFVTTTLEGVPAKTFYHIDWEEYNNVLTSWDETVQTGQDETVQTRCDETVQTITESTTETTTEKKNKQKSPGGFLDLEKIAPEKQTVTRKPKELIKFAYWPKGQDEWKHKFRTLENPTLDDKVELIVDRYKRLQPLDSKTRSRGKAHIRKLLESGRYSFKALYLAVERYHAMCQPCWAENWACSSYQNKDAWIESPYVKGIGNFFGKEAIYKTYTKRGYKADIEEEDWKFFQQWRQDRERHNDYAWKQNVTFNRMVALYGYTPEQLGGDYDRRYA